VGPPAEEARGMAEASVVDLVEGDLAYKLGPDRRPVLLHLLGRPPARRSPEASGRAAVEQEAVLPRMALEGRRTRAKLAEKLAAVVAAEGEQVEHDEEGGRLAPQPLDPRGRRVQPREERSEVEATVARDDDLTVEHEASLRERGERLDELGEVARERPPVAA